MPSRFGFAPSAGNVSLQAAARSAAQSGTSPLKSSRPLIYPAENSETGLPPGTSRTGRENCARIFLSPVWQATKVEAEEGCMLQFVHGVVGYHDVDFSYPRPGGLPA